MTSTIISYFSLVKLKPTGCKPEKLSLGSTINVTVKRRKDRFKSAQPTSSSVVKESQDNDRSILFR